MKLFRLALVSSGLLLALGTAQASDSAVINLSATVSPGSCTIAADNTNLDMGSIAFSNLAQSTVSTLPFAENARVTITCTALHQGVYFTVAGAAADIDTAAGQYSLGDFAETTTSAGAFTLVAANPVFTTTADTPGNDATVNCRENTAAAPAACAGPLRSDRQYTFGAVLADGITEMSFDLNGTLILPALEDLAGLTGEAQTFSTSYTVTAVF